MSPVNGPTAAGRLLGLAGRAVATGLVAVVTGFMVSRYALPKAIAESKDLEAAPAVLAWLAGLGPLLPFLGLPAVVLGVLALVSRPNRGGLAILAMLAATVAVVAVIGAMLGALLPMYRMPSDLMQ